MGQVATKICSPGEICSPNERTIQRKVNHLSIEAAKTDVPASTNVSPTRCGSTNSPGGSSHDNTETINKLDPTPSGSEKDEEEEAREPVVQRTDPITLDTIQGSWFNSMGTKIQVDGTKVSLNGKLMEVHPVILKEDGTVDRIGSIWQCWGWTDGNKLEFKEAPSREAATYARSVVWESAESEEDKKRWEQHMKDLGYAGSALGDLSKRGIEGCTPGSSDAFQHKSGGNDEEEIKELTQLILKWRETGMIDVKPRLVIPDYSNRSHTGISVEHMHYLAKSMVDKGFQKRDNATHYGHDMPVLVKETPQTELGKSSVENWHGKVVDDEGFPPVSHYQKTFKESTIYTSLGNGHFFQALNLIGTHSSPINDMSLRTGQRNYTYDHDPLLEEAIQVGVPSLVLRGDIPLKDRQTISRLLNSKREFRWIMSPRGEFLGVEEDTSQVSQFVAMSKVLDAVELNCLVRAELGVTESGRIGK